MSRSAHTNKISKKLQNRGIRTITDVKLLVELKTSRVWSSSTTSRTNQTLK